MYNPTFESVYSIVPSVPALLLLLIPAILMTVSIVREKELGSIINFYVTPTGRLEYLLGKQLPYVAIGMINFFILTALALIVFGVPIKGSFLMLTLCTLALRHGDDGHRHGHLDLHRAARSRRSSSRRSSPSSRPSSSPACCSRSRRSRGTPAIVGSIWPASYYMHSSLGAYTKGLGTSLMMGDIVFLACCIPVLLADQRPRPEEAGEVAMKSLLEHLLARAQGDPQPDERRRDGRVRRLRLHAGDLHPGDRHLERGQQRLDRLRRRGRLGAVQGAVQRLLSAAFQVSHADLGRPGAGRDGPGPPDVRRRDPASLRARPARRPQPDHPGEHRRDRHAAGRHRRRLHQEHHQRSGRVLPEARPTCRRRPPINLVVRKLFNPNGVSSWFKSVVAIINQITPADRGADGRRRDPRARARNARAPAGDAAAPPSRSRWPRSGPTAW